MECFVTAGSKASLSWRPGEQLLGPHHLIYLTENCHKATSMIRHKAAWFLKTNGQCKDCYILSFTQPSASCLNQEEVTRVAMHR